MSSAARSYGAVRALRKPSQSHGRPRICRRFAHEEHGASRHATTHAAPASEGFGRSFYLLLTLFPASYILYALSRPRTDGSPHPFTRVMSLYSDFREENERRAVLYTKMVEQAGHDKNLFYNTPGSSHHELRFPESFNVGSPINVPAGHYANMDKLVAHYKEKQFKEEEEKRALMKEGKLPGQKPYKGP